MRQSQNFTQGIFSDCQLLEISRRFADFSRKHRLKIETIGNNYGTMRIYVTFLNKEEKYDFDFFGVELK